MGKKPKARAVPNWTGVLNLWHLCDNPSCHRAAACRGDVRRCSPKNFQRLPERVKDWFFGLIGCREDGLSFDDAMAALDRTPAGPAFRDWCAVVGAAAQAQETRRQPTPP